MAGRGTVQEGSVQAAAYIAQKFEEYGLRGGWRDSRYVYLREIRIVQPLTQPELNKNGWQAWPAATWQLGGQMRYPDLIVRLRWSILPSWAAIIWQGGR